MTQTWYPDAQKVSSTSYVPSRPYVPSPLWYACDSLSLSAVRSKRAVHWTGQTSGVGSDQHHRETTAVTYLPPLRSKTFLTYCQEHTGHAPRICSRAPMLFFPSTVTLLRAGVKTLRARRSFAIKRARGMPPKGPV